MVLQLCEKSYKTLAGFKHESAGSTTKNRENHSTVYSGTCTTGEAQQAAKPPLATGNDTQE
jgi:hypothetical protein